MYSAVLSLVRNFEGHVHEPSTKGNVSEMGKTSLLCCGKTVMYSAVLSLVRNFEGHVRLPSAFSGDHILPSVKHNSIHFF